MDLKYGMKVMFRPLEFAGLIPGMAPNSYKVALVPVSETDKFAFGKEKVYSTDLKSMIQRGYVTILSLC